MLIFIIIMLFGIAFSVFATQNAHTWDIYFWNYLLDDIPAYLVVLVTMTLAFGLSAIVYMARSLSASLTKGDLEREIENLQKQLAEVTKSAHKLELENVKLRKGKKKVDENGF